MSPNDQAFPLNMRNDDGTHYFSCAGFTKRELIAAMAMQGMAANPGLLDMRPPVTPDRIAKGAVMMADLLIAALNEPQS